MPIDDQTTLQIVEELLAARTSNEAVEPITDRYELTIDDAYWIQEELLEELYSDPDNRRIGYKVGVTNEEGQSALGTNEPAYGVLYDDMLGFQDGVDTAELVDPRFEPEIGFLIGDTVRKKASILDVLAATEAVVPAVEIADSRITEWDVQIEDMISDNALAGGAIHGGVLNGVDGLDLAMESVQILKNGTLVGSGTAANVLGHPAQSVAWLAGKLDESGTRIEPGELVLSGSLTNPMDMEIDDVITIQFTTIGSVTFTVK